MALPSGTKLGPYEIRSALGAGGMGEVYRARDSRLDRSVAIKILHSHLSCSPELKARFEREARTLSSLSHPHICSLYDVGKDGEVEFLVMELLEGETLAARLQRGPLPLTAVVKLGIEVADALAKAHRLGVIHRDLKPSNIMLTGNGAKLMDFGLAKPSIVNSEAGPSLAELATATLQSPSSPLSSAGTLIGTIQYMAPEQIEGKEADARSDIFALGSVLYEALTGRRAFEGKTHLHIASAILQRDPPPITIQNPDLGLPPLEHTIRTCMAKEPDERFQTAHDVKLQLSWLAHALGREQMSGRGAWSKAALTAVGVLTVALLTTIFFFVRAVRDRAEIFAPTTTRFSITVPPPQELAVASGQAVTISLDGKALAYVVAENGVPRLFTRRFEQPDAVAVRESEGAAFPFFSPNGDWVAFFSQGKLKKAPTAGGTPVVICEVPTFFGGTWTPQDVIVVALPTYGLAKVSANGGPLQRIEAPTKDIFYPQGPTWLAGGEWIAFTDYLSQGRTIKLLKLSTGEIRTVLTNARAAAFVEGRVVYYQGDALWSAPFDPDRLSIRGSATKIESGIDDENYVVQAGISERVLAYVAGSAGSVSRALYAVDRKGQERKLDVPPHDYVDPVLSPDGKRLACLFRSTVGQQLVVLDIESGLFTTLISSGMNAAPAWTSDGKSLIFDDANSQGRAIYRVPADGSSGPQLFKVTSLSTHVTSVAGGYATLSVSDPTTSTDLWILNLSNPDDMRPFKRTPAAERQGSLSPDGRWMAYESNESGRSEIYVEPVPGPGGRRQISIDGGEEPRWVRNGREIAYRSGTKMISVPVQEQPVFQTGKPTELFDRKFDRGFAVAGYDVTPDGRTFIMTRSEHTPRNEIRVVMGWLEKQGNQ
ncbi:MAG TPA: protein kinase [Candidatus Sulfotelmatobacter sp.]|nr:protein kinase [Candidatus Sulfotelmatobacter sp.]